MAFAVDSERKTQKQINIIEQHLVSHYDGTICMQKSSLKWFLWSYILFDSPLSSLVRHCLTREVTYQQRYLPLGN